MAGYWILVTAQNVWGLDRNINDDYARTLDKS